uniref:C2H2-type domain-containing protein n=1 Tax=viral metagenome TaxID=1070528 RepID=A0A6C0B1K1_9ZZZZ
MLVTNFTPKTPIFECNTCDFITSNKKDFKRHLLTIKHKNGVIVTVGDSFVTELPQKPSFECCNCDKIYKSRNGLWSHKKKCREQKKMVESAETDKTNKSSNVVIMELLKQNQEFKHMLLEQNNKIMEIAKEKQNITNTTNHINNFNMQFFLNEQCKDALNIMEFVNTLKLQLSDLELVGRLGYTEGISKIFIRGLRELDIFKRPIHCSDLKRETLYIKDKDAWEKENSENIKIKQAINYIVNKNIKQIPKWMEENPAAEDTETKKHLDYIHIVHESMGGASTESEEKKQQKIIRNVAKEVLIDKNK